MKTAEEIFNEYSREDLGLISASKRFCVPAMKAYAKQVADQALKDAAKKAILLYESDSTGKISHYGCTYGTENGEVRVDRESILSTPITTPQHELTKQQQRAVLRY